MFRCPGQLPAAAAPTMEDITTSLPQRQVTTSLPQRHHRRCQVK
ncbi:unnamed protein product [Ixodes persulcatus]